MLATAVTDKCSPQNAPMMSMLSKGTYNFQKQFNKNVSGHDNSPLLQVISECDLLT